MRNADEFSLNCPVLGVRLTGFKIYGRDETKRFIPIAPVFKSRAEKAQVLAAGGLNRTWPALAWQDMAQLCTWAAGGKSHL